MDNINRLVDLFKEETRFGERYSDICFYTLLSPTLLNLIQRLEWQQNTIRSLNSYYPNSHLTESLNTVDADLYYHRAESHLYYAYLRNFPDITLANVSNLYKRKLKSRRWASRLAVSDGILYQLDDIPSHLHLSSDYRTPWAACKRLQHALVRRLGTLGYRNPVSLRRSWASSADVDLKILSLLPSDYIEQFDHWYSVIASIEMSRLKLMLINCSTTDNPLMRFLLAKAKKMMPIISLTHGGGYDFQKLSALEDLENRLTDIRIPWASNSDSASPLSGITLEPKGLVAPRNQSDEVVIVGPTLKSYFRYSFGGTDPIHNGTLIKRLRRLMDGLTKNKIPFTFVPHPRSTIDLQSQSWMAVHPVKTLNQALITSDKFLLMSPFTALAQVNLSAKKVFCMWGGEYQLNRKVTKLADQLNPIISDDVDYLMQKICEPNDLENQSKFLNITFGDRFLSSSDIFEVAHIVK